MRRKRITPRDNWQKRVEDAGLTYHSHANGPYWDESACYMLTMREVEVIEKAAGELHMMCIEAADTIVQSGDWHRLAVPEAAVPSIIDSWKRDDFSLYGRFDLAWDGTQPPKMLEYNADTPTALVEAAVAQWYWLQDTNPECDQFNSIHERLVEAWGKLKGKTVHFCHVEGQTEDEQTALYLGDTALQAGCKPVWLKMGDIGWDPKLASFVDLDGNRLENAFKLYPWEWLWTEEFSRHLPSTTAWIEPAWKMLLSNKGLLPVLWETYPGHPNLLPAFDSPEKLTGDFVKKPKLSREGANIELWQKGACALQTVGEYGSEGHVYQQAAPLAFDGENYAVMGAWIVDHEPAGLGIREDTQPITGNLSRFVPHFLT